MSDSRHFFFILGNVLFQGVEVNEFVDYRVDGQSGGGMDVELAGDILAVRNDGVGGDTQHIGYLFVAQSAYNLHEHVPLAVGQFFRVRGYGIRVTGGGFAIIGFGYCRAEDVIFYRAMVCKIMLGVPEIGHDADQ